MKLCTASVVDGFDGLVLCAGQTRQFLPPPRTVWCCPDGVCRALMQCFVCLNVAFPDRWLMPPGWLANVGPWLLLLFEVLLLAVSFPLKDGRILLEIRCSWWHQSCRHCFALFFSFICCHFSLLGISFFIQLRELARPPSVFVQVSLLQMPIFNCIVCTFFFSSCVVPCFIASSGQG